MSDFSLGPRTAIVALGSNLGEPRAALERAFVELKSLARAPDSFRTSSVWSSQPVDCPPGSPDFLNAVCLFQPFDHETPESLLDRLQTLERSFGRRPKQVLNEPRPLDLDLIAFGSERRSTARLILPHPRAHLRGFVLAPLQEIAPHLVLPGWGASVGTLLSQLPSGIESLRRTPAG